MRVQNFITSKVSEFHEYQLHDRVKSFIICKKL